MFLQRAYNITLSLQLRTSLYVDPVSIPLTSSFLFCRVMGQFAVDALPLLSELIFYQVLLVLESQRLVILLNLDDH